MKKIILTAVVALCAMSANAQIWVGGGLGFTHKDYDDKVMLLDETAITISPEVGYTLNEKWDLALAVGAELRSFSDGGGSNNNFTVNPYARYTFYKTGKVGFFCDGGFAFTAGDDPTEFFVGLRPGIKYAASDKVTFVMTFGGLGYKSVEDNYNEFGFDFDTRGLAIGCYYSF